MFIGKLFSGLNYYQIPEYASAGPMSQAFHRLCCPLLVNNNLTHRIDINSSEPTKLPICKKSHQAVVEKFLAAIIKLLLKLGMKVQDIPKVTIHSLYFGIMAGIGLHSDSLTKDDDDDLSCGLILRKKEGHRRFNFLLTDSMRAIKKASRKVYGLSFDILSEEGTRVYFPTPHGNVKFAMCWADAEKEVGIRAKHRVTRIEPDGKEAVIFVIDFCYDLCVQ